MRNKEKKRAFELLGTTVKHPIVFDPRFIHFDSILEIGLKGQTALTIKQFLVFSRLYKNWFDWRIRLAIWLISKTKL